MKHTARWMAGCAAVLAVTPLAACTGGSAAAPASHTATPASPAATSAVIATRWWSDGAHPAGSTIDPAHPSAAASDLHPSRHDYCAVLRETLAAGGSILPDASATDPALLTATEAFVAEVQHVAPARLANAWQLLGDALVAFVRSGGNSLGPGVGAPDVQRAASTVSADASANCGLDLDASTG